ncbi:MAG TPA: zinc-dependent alcohol dehydrogenase family protein [Verrucomicrobiae bacterium]|jgi:propanol-preferring alcohol dehydrogenase|nr:zinc-dependent alcohol dehydrogenase family protein [Verrucomicrobiae bacterium]
MRCMVLNTVGQLLQETEHPVPAPQPGQVRVRVLACAVCRTDLHVTAGELSNPKLPLIPGHEIVGTIDALGAGVKDFKLGDRVGIPWLGWTCGVCAYCTSGRENLCDTARFTGYTLDGGFAEYTVADARFCFRIPEKYSDAEAAPLLCAGLIGYRSLCKTGEAKRIGIYGFGAAAHIVTQVARHQGREIYAFSRPGNSKSGEFARSLGAVWTGNSTATPPKPLDAAIIFAPSGELVPLALKSVRKGGTVVCGGIHMSDIPSFPYNLLWEERTLCSVANLTRQDGLTFLPLAAEVPVKTTIETFPLSAANEALDCLRNGKLRGAAVLLMT